MNVYAMAHYRHMTFTHYEPTIDDLLDAEHDAAMASVSWRVDRDADGYGVAVKCFRPAACTFDGDV